MYFAVKYGNFGVFCVFLEFSVFYDVLCVLWRFLVLLVLFGLV